MATQEVTLQPGESQVVSFQAVPQQAKVYQVSVNGLTGSFRAIEAAPAQFIYASDIRQQDWPGPSGWGGVKFEVDIQNTGGQPANCTPIATIDTCYGGHEVPMGTSTINPGEVVTFYGQWFWPHGVLEADEWWRPYQIKSEAGIIFFGLPREAQPWLISIDIPPAKAAHGFMPSAQLHLPQPTGLLYQFKAFIPGAERQRNLYEFLNWNFLPTKMAGGKYLPLNSPDNTYNFEGCPTYYGEWPEGYWGVGECLLWLPPGTYPVYASLRSSTLTAGDDGWGITVPQYFYELGLVGVLNLELADWFELSNMKYPATAQDGQTVTVRVDVSNIGIAAGTREIIWRSKVSKETRQTISLNPGETKTCSFTLTIPASWRYTTVSGSAEIEGFGRLEFKIET